MAAQSKTPVRFRIRFLVGLVAGCLGCLGCRGQPEPETTPAAMPELGVLAAPPLVGRPTADSVTVRIVSGAEPSAAELSRPGAEPLRIELEAHTVHDFVVSGLEPGQEVEYEIVARSGDLEDIVQGRLRTRRRPGEEFTFAVFADPHLPVPALEWLQTDDEEAMSDLLQFSLLRAELGTTFRRAMAGIRAARPDFVVCLGDMLYLPAYEFNPPFPSAGLAEAAYLDFRNHLGPATTEAAFFAVVGNWEGENGWHPEALRAHAVEARRRYLLNPSPETYPEGAGALEDYYAFTWGDALFVVLNVMGYTTSVHTLGDDEDGTATSWTLGTDQWSWLEGTFEASIAPVKLVFAHHTVGGNGGDEPNSAYGRGGYRAARVGEQARLHELMIRHGVQAFVYGHDHVFTERAVDSVHYVLPGSAGAPWKFETAETGYDDYDPRSGFALMRVAPREIRVEFHDLEGDVFRRFGIPRGLQSR